MASPIVQNVSGVDFNGTADRGLVAATSYVPADDRYRFIIRSLCFTANGAVTSASLIYRLSGSADPLDDCLKRTWTFSGAPFTIFLDCCCLIVPHPDDVIFTTTGIGGGTDARLSVDFSMQAVL